LLLASEGWYLRIYIVAHQGIVLHKN